MYEERIIAFIDILGFKNEIEKKTINSFSGNENEQESERIYDFISLLHKDFVNRNPIPKSTYCVTQFSDSLVISYSISEKASLFSIILSLLYLHMDAISHGLLIRGGVTSGKLMHDDKHLFGPAMNEAYKIESEIAIFPRIVVNKELIEIAYNNPNWSNTPEDEKKYIESLLQKDEDGFLYIDYFYSACEEIIGIHDYYGLPDYFNDITKIIDSNENTKDFKIIQKYNWLKIQFNKILGKYKNLDFTKNPTYEEIADYFNSLDFYEI